MQAAYAGWEAARRNIYEDWQQATDPANLQPRVRPALKAAADQLRRYPPPGVVQDDLNQVVESIEAPWGIRIEKQIKEALQSAKGEAASAEIVATVKRLGLEPFKAPEPLPPIELSDVRLVCWMSIVK